MSEFEQPEQQVSELTVTLPSELVEQVAQRVAEILAPRFEAPAVPDYMTVKQACDYAGFTPQRIYDLRSEGKLTRYGDGRSVRVARAELDEILAGPGGGSPAGVTRLPVRPRLPRDG